MMLSRLLTAAVAFFLLSGFFSRSSHNTVQLNTASGYTTEGWLYPAEGTPKTTGIVFLHGKRGNPGVEHNRRFIAELRGLGYPVMAPLMPWSEKRGYQGTREQGLEVIDVAVAALATDQVVVIGHSMGGAGVLQYGAEGPGAKVVGLVAVAAGHDPNNARKFRQRTEADAARACGMVDAGEGRQRARFNEQNTGKQYSITASAEYYCSYYSVERYPDSLRIAADIRTPLFILSGADDRLTRVYRHEDIYRTLPANDKHRFELASGGHKDVLFKHPKMIAQWIESLQATARRGGQARGSFTHP